MRPWWSNNPSPTFGEFLEWDKLGSRTKRYVSALLPLTLDPVPRLYPYSEPSSTHTQLKIYTAV